MDLYSPKLTEFIVTQTQWNINSFKAIEQYLVEIKEERHVLFLKTLIDTAVDLNESLLGALTRVPKDEKIQ